MCIRDRYFCVNYGGRAEIVDGVRAIAREVEAMLQVGMTPTEAIGAATWEAREWLGHEGLTEGASADVVVYADDPRRDVRALAAPAHVVLRGVRHGG